MAENVRAHAPGDGRVFSLRPAEDRPWLLRLHGRLYRLEIVFLLTTLILGGVAFAIGSALHLAGVPSAVLMALAIILGILWYLFHFFVVLIYCFGIVLTFLDAYPLYFLGGRYPLLGDLMDRSEAAPLYPYSPSYPPPGQFPPPAPLGS